MSNLHAPSFNAYGLTFGGMLAAGLGGLLASESTELPPVLLAWDPTHLVEPRVGIREDDAVLPLLLGGHLVANRPATTATFTGTPKPDSQYLAHPGLASVGAIFSHWHGRLAFHGGGVIAGNAAYGVLGDREAGKSTTLASLAVEGRNILSDDLLVLDHGQALRGPRTIDLRPDAAAHVPADLYPVRNDARRRMLLSYVPERVPLAGWIVLSTSESVSVQAVEPRDRLGVLAGQLAIRVAPSSPEDFLIAASAPMWRVTRTRDWRQTPELLSAIGDLIGA